MANVIPDDENYGRHLNGLVGEAEGETQVIDFTTAYMEKRSEACLIIARILFLILMIFGTIA